MNIKKIALVVLLFGSLFSTLCTQSAKAEVLPDLELEMGSIKTLQSKILKEQRSLFVRLPKEYHQQEKSYPVLYLLDANDFFSGNIYQQTVALVSRLEAIHDIPEMIVVGIQSDQWYKDVITDSAAFEHYVSREVSQYIDNQYRTMANRILVGHSYAGAFVSGALPLDKKSFDLFLTLSPVYPSLSFIEKIEQRYAALKPLSAKLVIIDGDENPMDKLILKQAASQLAKDTLSFSYHSLKLDGHMSVAPIGLSHALREHFSDYRSPSRALLTQQTFDLNSIRDYYIAKDKKYGTKTDEAFIKSIAINIAHSYTSMSKLELALPLWRFGESRFKEYFMAGYADRFIKLGKMNLAIHLWKEMAVLFPESNNDYLKKIELRQKTTKK